MAVTNTSSARIVLYETTEPLRNSERWIAWLTEDRAVVDKQGKKTGETKTVFLPVYFFGETYQSARDRALAFWDYEKAKKVAKAERGRKLGSTKAAVGGSPMTQPRADSEMARGVDFAGGSYLGFKQGKTPSVTLSRVPMESQTEDIWK